MKTIPLTQGKVALVDDDLYPYLIMNKWYAVKGRHCWYAATHAPKSNGYRVIFLHNCIVESSGILDHKDGDGLNNQRFNLRDSTLTQNRTNSTVRRDSRSGIKGIRLSRKTNLSKPWVARIGKNGKSFFLGCFKTKEEAANAYDSAAIQKHGEFARTNKNLGLL